MKKNLNALGKRALALLVVLTMCVSLLQVTAFAAPEDDPADEVVTEQQKPAEPTEPETKEEQEQPAEPTGPEAKEEQEQPAEPTEPETKEEQEQPAESTEPETKEEQEQPAEPTKPETKEEQEQPATTPTPAPTEKPAAPVKPLAPMSPVVTNPAGALDYILNSFMENKSETSNCCKAEIVEKGGQKICSNCRYPVASTEKPSEPEHVCDYDKETDRCECGKLNPEHVHDFGEDNKCRCGEQHEHDWKYTPKYYEYFTHTKYCASCGEKVKEACTKSVVTEYGQKISKCNLCNYWNEPYVEHEHKWDTWVPDEKGHHVQKCTDPTCKAEREEECKPEARPDGTVVCPTCGWVKFDDGKPGVDDQCKDGHTLGNVYTSNGDYSHSVECMVCPTKVTQRCEMDTLYIDGKPVTHYCNICGQQKPIYGDGYCKDENGHKFEETNQVLSEDGKSVLTTQTCKICGLVKIQEICHSPSTVIVHYVYADGKQALPDATQSVIAGMPYLITSPTIEGYTPDKAIISGTCEDGKGAEFTVTYTKVDTYTLTVKYEVEGGQKVLPTHTEQVKAGAEYNVKSPELFGYTPEWESVSGTMPASDKTVTVKYTPTEYKWTIKYVDENDKELHKLFVQPYTINTVKGLTPPDIPDVEGYKVKTTSLPTPDPEKLGDVEGKVVYIPDDVVTYTLTIKYEFVGGGEVFEAYVAQLEAGEAYNVPSKELLGYTPEKEIVSGTMPAADEKVTVKYTLDKYTWTINYVDQNGNKLFDSAVRGFDVTNIKSLEGVSSPTQKGYTADKTFVSAPTALDNVTVDVVYTLSADFNLTVIHRYVGRDGTVIEVTQDLGKRQIGDQYTTSSVAREGYTLSATPDNANGVFGDQDVTVTYVYNANAPSGGGGGGGTTPTPRPEDPEPPVDVPDPDVPLVPGPDEPDTPVTPDPGPGDVDIDDPDVPLAPNPDVPGDVDIPDTDVPTTSKPNNPSKPAVKNPAPQTSTLTEIEDEDVPLAAVPQTGDNSGAWIAAAILAACGLVVLGKKREEA